MSLLEKFNINPKKVPTVPEVAENHRDSWSYSDYERQHALEYLFEAIETEVWDPLRLEALILRFVFVSFETHGWDVNTYYHLKPSLDSFLEDKILGQSRRDKNWWLQLFANAKKHGQDLDYLENTSLGWLVNDLRVKDTGAWWVTKTQTGRDIVTKLFTEFKPEVIKMLNRFAVWSDPSLEQDYPEAVEYFKDKYKPKFYFTRLIILLNAILIEYDCKDIFKELDLYSNLPWLQTNVAYLENWKINIFDNLVSKADVQVISRNTVERYMAEFLKKDVAILSSSLEKAENISVEFEVNDELNKLVDQLWMELENSTGRSRYPTVPTQRDTSRALAKLGTKGQLISRDGLGSYSQFYADMRESQNENIPNVIPKFERFIKHGNYRISRPLSIQIDLKQYFSPWEDSEYDTFQIDPRDLISNFLNFLKQGKTISNIDFENIKNVFSIACIAFSLASKMEEKYSKVVESYMATGVQATGYSTDSTYIKKQSRDITLEVETNFIVPTTELADTNKTGLQDFPKTTVERASKIFQGIYEPRQAAREHSIVENVTLFDNNPDGTIALLDANNPDDTTQTEMVFNEKTAVTVEPQNIFSRKFVIKEQSSPNKTEAVINPEVGCQILEIHLSNPRPDSRVEILKESGNNLPLKIIFYNCTGNEIEIVYDTGKTGKTGAFLYPNYTVSEKMNNYYQKNWEKVLSRGRNVKIWNTPEYDFISYTLKQKIVNIHTDLAQDRMWEIALDRVVELVRELNIVYGQSVLSTYTDPVSALKVSIKDKLGNCGTMRDMFGLILHNLGFMVLGVSGLVPIHNYLHCCHGELVVTFPEVIEGEIVLSTPLHINPVALTRMVESNLNIEGSEGSRRKESKLLPLPPRPDIDVFRDYEPLQKATWDKQPNYAQIDKKWLPALKQFVIAVTIPFLLQSSATFENSKAVKQSTTTNTGQIIKKADAGNDPSLPISQVLAGSVGGIMTLKAIKNIWEEPKKSNLE